MNKCEVCGNSYDKMLEIKYNGETHFFDSFECAIEEIAPVCGHCGCRIIGHGVQSGQDMYCCSHCAKAKGVEGTVDRV